MLKFLFESWNTRLRESSANNWQEQNGSKIYTSATSGLSDYECSTNTGSLAFVCFCLFVSKTDFEAISDKCRCHQTLLWGKITPMTSRNVQQQLSLGELLKVEAKVCANLQQDNQQCVLFAVLHPPNGLYRLQGIWARAADRISMKLYQVLVHVVLRVSPNTCCGDMGWFSSSPNHLHVCWNMAGNVFGGKMYPFKSTTKSYPCVATDIF